MAAISYKAKDYNDENMVRVIDYINAELAAGNEGFITISELSQTRYCAMIEQPCIDVALCSERIVILTCHATQEEIPLIFYNTANIMDKSFKRKKKLIQFLGNYSFPVQLDTKQYSFTLMPPEYIWSK